MRFGGFCFLVFLLLGLPLLLLTYTLMVGSAAFKTPGIITCFAADAREIIFSAAVASNAGR